MISTRARPDRAFCVTQYGSKCRISLRDTEQLTCEKVENLMQLDHFVFAVILVLTSKGMPHVKVYILENGTIMGGPVA